MASRYTFVYFQAERSASILRRVISFIFFVATLSPSCNYYQKTNTGSFGENTGLMIGIIIILFTTLR